MPQNNISRIFPAESAHSVSPDDSGRFDPTRAVYVGGEGNLRVMMWGGQVVTFSGVTAGTMLPISITRVYSTGTTATNILVLR